MADKPSTANFFPDVPDFPSMGTFQPVYGKFDLTTYIQGASDYEIMAFLVGKYNACLEAYGTVTKLSKDTVTACKQLQSWINTWFDNLDVQEELNNKIDNMVKDGSFESLLHQTFDEQINNQTANAVTAWLVANVTPTGSAVVVDKSLTVEGAAADAKETGLRYHYYNKRNSKYTVDINELNLENCVTAINAATNVLNAPNSYWKDGTTWYLYNYYDSSNPEHITQILVNYTGTVNLAREYIATSATWTKWATYTSFTTNNYIGLTLDCNEVANKSCTYIFNATSTVTNAPINDWTDGSAWYLDYYYDPINPLYTFEYFHNWNHTVTCGRVHQNINNFWTEWAISRDAQNAQTVLECGTGKQFTTLRSVMEKAIEYQNAVVNVYPGTYDLTTEFADVIAAKSGTGIKLGNGVTVNFMAGSYVKAIFDTLDEWYLFNFEPFKVIGSFTLNGLNIEAKNTRYCVHDDLSGVGTYTNRYINCVMSYTSTDTNPRFVQCIGGGLAEHSYIEITGGVYTTKPAVTDASAQLAISYHNGTSSSCDSKIFIGDVMLTGKGRFRFTHYGTSTTKSQVVVNNCLMGNSILVAHEGGSSGPENMEVIEYNNTISS